ncbi:S1 family peptidase [Falsiruegeria mediterranea]
MPALTDTEKLLYSTARISTFKGGNQIGSGTGFFFDFEIKKDKIVPAIITNNHVLEGCDYIEIVCHIAEGDKPSGNTLNVRLDIHDDVVIRHPDLHTDLCAVLIGREIHMAKEQGTPIIYTGLNFNNVPADNEWQSFDAIEEVAMIGCPNGIFDEFNNLPIVRRGHTASPLYNLYQGKHEFMIDMACFPGSSGSPVFLYNQHGYLDRLTGSKVIGGSRLRFVGILYSGPVITNDGQIVLRQEPKVEVTAMMHLGNVIRSSQLHKIEGQIRTRFDSTA